MPTRSQSLRIGGSFAIMAAGSLGIILPVFLHSFHDGRAVPAILLLKAFAAGIIIALATVHLLTESYISLASLPPGTLYNDFPICGVFVTTGILIMFVAERLSLDFIASGSVGAGEAVDLSDVESPQLQVHSHEHLVALTAAREAAGAHAGHSHAHAPAKDAPPAAKDGSDVHHAGNGHGGHAHGMLVVGAGNGALTPAAARRRVLIARFLEFSIVIHSLVIGLNLGTTTGPHNHSLRGHAGHGGHTEEEHDDHRDEPPLYSLGAAPSHVYGPPSYYGAPPAHHDDHEEHEEEEEGHDDHGHDADMLDPANLRPIVVLIIVLCFHQLFEGIALGSYIAELREAASRSSKVIMSAIFVLTVPLGCWVGIGVAESYDAESPTALWVTGALNALTGGMLLYNGLITFLGEEFSRDDLGPGAEGRRLKQKMYLMVLFGAASMAVLGLWA